MLIETIIAGMLTHTIDRYPVYTNTMVYHAYTHTATVTGQDRDEVQCVWTWLDAIHAVLVDVYCRDIADKTLRTTIVMDPSKDIGDYNETTDIITVAEACDDATEHGQLVIDILENRLQDVLGRPFHKGELDMILEGIEEEY